MLWMLPLAVSGAGLALLTILVSRLRREIEPTVTMVDRFGREHRVALESALTRLRAETSETRRRISRD